MVPLGLVAMFSLATSAAGLLLPDLVLRDEAEKRRRAFRHTPSSYLAPVNVLLAGGAGIETAPHAPAEAGDGWLSQTTWLELRRARLTQHSRWDTFDTLAEHVAPNDLPALKAT